MRSRDVLIRLRGIERQLTQIKIALLFLSVLLVFGLFGPKELVAAIGSWLFALVIIGAAIYGFLIMLESLPRLLDGDRKTEQRIREEIEQIKEMYANHRQEQTEPLNHDVD